MDISCSFATTLDTPDHISIAEDLGYVRAWCYDSPAIYPDVWMVLARAAARTSRIGLGPGVLIPSLRHPLVTASAAAALEAWAPGRVTLGVGAGFTGRRALGQRPLPWSWVASYVRALRALLRGETVEWEGAAIRMIHDDSCAPERPIDIPILIAANGPKGRAVADDLADGIFVVGANPPASTGAAAWWAQLSFGTVLDDAEELTSRRVADAIGAGLALAYHATYEGSPDAVDGLPGGARWRAAVEAVPVAERHLAVHEGHLLRASPIDRLIIDDAVPMARTFTLTGTAGEVRQRLAAMAAAGVTELVYQPMGPDIPRELRAFADAAGVSALE
jgi:5,10-methylenetetrahydromethanopterin reductase